MESVAQERDRKCCVETTQEVEIFFNFIGKYTPPHFGEVSLTPEEQEEIRKREERRERLHQNYLRRKASGKVAEEYERTKAKKKAAMDAKKTALRMEDVSKGVFIAANALPKKTRTQQQRQHGFHGISTKPEALHAQM